MQGTLEMMKSIINGKEKELSKIELIDDYKKTLAPNLLAYMYISNYGLITSICRLYPLIENADKASFCLQELDNCLLSYDASIGQFSTYFSKCFKNRLRTEVETLLCQKKKANLFIDALEDYTEIIGYDMQIQDTDLLLSNYNLTLKEKEHCKLLYSGLSFKQLAKRLNVSLQTIYQRNRQIHKKFSI